MAMAMAMAGGEESSSANELLQPFNWKLALAASVIFALSFAYLFFSRHPRYGGNRGAAAYPLIGTLVAFLRNRHKMLDFFTDLLRRDASLTIRNSRPGREVLITANPVNVEHVLRTNFHNYPKGAYVKATMDDVLGDGIFNADGELWKIQRKVASQEFSSRSLRDFAVDCVKKEISGRLLPTLQHFSDRAIAVDLQILLRRFAFDTICELSFGMDPGCLHHSLPVVKFAQAVDEATSIVAGRFKCIHPRFWHLKRALNVGSERRLRNAMQVVDEFAMDAISSRRKEIKEDGNSRLDLLSRFIDCIEQPEIVQDLARNISKNFNGNKFLKDVLISFIFAGMDTTSIALSWFFWLLCTHSQVEQRCYDEIKNILDQRKPATSQGNDENLQGDTLLSYSELKELHYLQAAISESLRLYPPVPANPKVSMAEDVWPDGTKVSKNMGVVYHPYAMGRMESIWGKDCLKFKPERWLKDGQFVPENPYKFAVFQAGPRICLGKDMALIQMKYVAASIIYNFRMKLSHPELKPRSAFSLTMKMMDGLSVSVSRRQLQHVPSS